MATSIPFEAVSYGGNPLMNKERSRNVEAMVNQAPDAVCELIGVSFTSRSAGWRRVSLVTEPTRRRKSVGLQGPASLLYSPRHPLCHSVHDERQTYILSGHTREHNGGQPNGRVRGEALSRYPRAGERLPARPIFDVDARASSALDDRDGDEDAFYRARITAFDCLAECFSLDASILVASIRPTVAWHDRSETDE
jgi:hypothetical protein